MSYYLFTLFFVRLSIVRIGISKANEKAFTLQYLYWYLYLSMMKNQGKSDKNISLEVGNPKF